MPWELENLAFLDAMVPALTPVRSIVDGKRVVRVNDVQLIEVGEFWRVTGADVTLAGAGVKFG